MLFDFPDYSVEELLEIFIRLLNKEKFTISEDAKEKVKSIIAKCYKMENFGNGRFINNIYQKIIMKHASNVYKNLSEENVISIDDIDEANLIEGIIVQDENFGF